MRPRARRSAGSTAWVTAIWPMRFTSSCRRRSSIGMNSSGPATATPALFTTPASGPSAKRARSASIEPESVTSSRIVSMPAAPSRSASSSLRTPATTSKPRPRRWRAVASPIPVDAPVTSTVPLGISSTAASRPTYPLASTAVELEHAIRTRRTHKAYGPDPVDRGTLEELLELARWAPNHHLTNPWRFRVLGPEALAAAEGGGRAGGGGQARPRAHARGGVRHADRRPGAGRGGRARRGRGHVHRAASAAHGRGLAGYWRTPGRPALGRRAARRWAWRPTSWCSG